MMQSIQPLDASWDRPSNTGSGSSSYPLLRYDFEYFKDGSDATSLTKVSLFDININYTTPPLNLGDLYKGRIRAVTDVSSIVTRRQCIIEEHAR